MQDATRQRISEIVPSMHGWMPVKKALQMADEIINNKVDLSVEIGVFGGRGSAACGLAHQEAGGIHYGLDTWEKSTALEGENDAVNNAWWSGVNLEEIYRTAHGSLFHYNLSFHARLLRLSSYQASRIFKPATIGLLHIDGNHSEQASCQDVDMWFPLVKPGGVIFFDDANWATTQRAQKMLDHACSRSELHSEGDNQWRIFYKIKKD
jgi:hypothetical protein